MAIRILTDLAPNRNFCGFRKAVSFFMSVSNIKLKEGYPQITQITQIKDREKTN